MTSQPFITSSSLCKNPERQRRDVKARTNPKQNQKKKNNKKWERTDRRDWDKINEDDHFMENVEDDYQWVKGSFIVIVFHLPFLQFD